MQKIKVLCQAVQLWECRQTERQTNTQTGKHGRWLSDVSFPDDGLSDLKCTVPFFGNWKHSSFPIMYFQALDIDSKATKAFFRRGQAYYAQQEWEVALVSTKDVPIFISASAISAYRHFFSISAYRLSANISSADIADIWIKKSSHKRILSYENIGNISILAITNIGVSAYRQKCHIGKSLSGTPTHPLK